MGVRLYDPKLGRFLEVDPIIGGSCNDYDYTCGDPVNASDLGGAMRDCECSSPMPMVPGVILLVRNLQTVAVGTAIVATAVVAIGTAGTAVVTFAMAAGALAGAVAIATEIVSTTYECADQGFSSKACAFGMGELALEGVTWGGLKITSGVKSAVLETLELGIDVFDFLAGLGGLMSLFDGGPAFEMAPGPFGSPYDYA